MAKGCILVALLAVACSTTVSCALSNPTNGIGTWTNLFQSRQGAGKGDIGNTGLSCNTNTSCYVYKIGSPSTGDSALYSFSGVPNGAFTPLKMPYPDRITAVAVSGPMDAPGGAVVTWESINYPVNNMTFVPSNTPLSSVSACDARTSSNGQEVLVINCPANVLYSSNGGKDFNLKTINVKFATNHTSALYGALVDKNTWYVAMGSAANNHQYSAQIVKTTDGGNTWTTQFSEVSNFYFTAIECLSATHCVAIGEGLFGGDIYRTTDGHTWNQVFDGSSDTFPTLLRANAHGHLFVAGYEFLDKYPHKMSYMLTSVDGGATWVKANPLPNVIAITGLSFTPGGVGFATALYNSHSYFTILRYDPAPSQLLH